MKADWRHLRHLTCTTPWRSPVVWLLAATFLACNIGCGLQHSFRRPKKAKKEETSGQARPQLAGHAGGYVRAFYSWSADHSTLLERLKDNPKVVGGIYVRLQEHLRSMQSHMYRKEGEVFRKEVIGVYDSLMAPWPNAHNLTTIERRLKRLETRIREDYPPGKFPLKGPGEAEEEFED